jgi:hypothetical protein
MPRKSPDWAWSFTTTLPSSNTVAGIAASGFFSPISAFNPHHHQGLVMTYEWR